MSSFVRTLEKRHLKRMGFHRRVVEVRKDINGTPYIHRYAKGKGPIINPKGEVVGQHYPRKGLPA